MLGQIDERHARKSVRHFAADCTDDRGKNVDELRGHGDAFAGEILSRKFDDQRNVEHFAIEQNAVLRFAVIAESFAVIAAENNERFVVEPALLQFVEKLADIKIGGGDLAVIRARRVFRFERLDRLVRRVRLEEMKEEEKWF